MSDPPSQGESFTKNGYTMCQICFDMFGKDDLEPVSDTFGQVWDICQPCAAMERSMGATF